MTAHGERGGVLVAPEDIPVTLQERVAWALCVHDTSTSDGGYLNEVERAELSLLLSRSKMQEFPALRRLLHGEIYRADQTIGGLSALAAVRLAKAFWRDYEGWAGAALSVALQDSRVAFGAPDLHETGAWQRRKPGDDWDTKRIFPKLTDEDLRTLNLEQRPAPPRDGGGAEE